MSRAAPAGPGQADVLDTEDASVARQPGEFRFHEEVKRISDRSLHLPPCIVSLGLLLDTANTIVGLHVVSIGGLAAAIVEPRQVFKAAVLANAAAIVVAHNHPSVNPEPSREDIVVTKQLVEAGKLMGIPVHDHLILAGWGYTSLAERGLM